MPVNKSYWHLVQMLHRSVNGNSNVKPYSGSRSRLAFQQPHGYFRSYLSHLTRRILAMVSELEQSSFLNRFSRLIRHGVSLFNLPMKTVHTMYICFILVWNDKQFPFIAPELVRDLEKSGFESNTLAIRLAGLALNVSSNMMYPSPLSWCKTKWDYHICQICVQPVAVHNPCVE